MITDDTENKLFCGDVGQNPFFEIPIFQIGG